MSLCIYKNIFGEPGVGVHEVSFMNIAVVDVIGTIAMGSLISRVFNISEWIAIVLLLIIAEVFHYAFCVETRGIQLIKKGYSMLTRSSSCQNNNNDDIDGDVDD